MRRRGYSGEFGRRVLDLLAQGRSVASVAHDLDLSDQTIYNLASPGSNRSGPSARSEHRRARRGRGGQEADRRAGDRVGCLATVPGTSQGGRQPKRRYAAIEVMAAESLPVQVACTVLGVSESGYYAHRHRAPSERSIRHAMLTDLITQIHDESHGIYGARRVHAELTLGRGVLVGHNQVQLLMHRAALQGITGRRKWKRIRPDHIATDRVERGLARSGSNQLWVTDITEHPTREGKVYCCVILDTYSRRVVGWSIDASPTGALVTNALGMAINSRLNKALSPATIIHSDQGVRGCPGLRGT